MRFRNLFFDFDGTLADPASGIPNGVSYALAALGKSADAATLRSCIGPSLPSIFGDIFKLGPEDTALAITKYREYFTATGMYEAVVYEGVPEMLERLQREGCTLFVATNKLESSAKAMLRHYGLERFFTLVAGTVVEEGRVRKEDILRYILAQTGMPPDATRLMIGDRSHDVEAAHAVNMPCLGVLYGYGSREELEEAGAEFFSSSPGALLEWLLCG